MIISDGIKIQNLKIGTRVWIDGPFGIFTLNNAVNKECVFIAGGIGITPILSIIKSIQNKNNVVLFYSNKTEEEINFKREIIESNTKTYYFNTSLNKNNRVTVEKIINFCPNYKDKDYYICGPLQMTLGLVTNLKKVGVSEEQIHFEKFNY